MILFWILFFLFSFWTPVWDISSFSHYLHNQCLEKLYFNTPLSDIYKALICGQRLPYGQIKQAFIQGGIVHLTVVSGAHLLFIERLWEKTPLPTKLKTHGLFLLLFLYACMSSLYPPVVRALFSFFLLQIARHFKLFWSTQHLTALSAILCLIYKPVWVHSFSLQLSLLACLLYNTPLKPLPKCFFIYLFILPVINRWQALHPLSVFINWTLAPFIGSVLFPLSFIGSFFPFFYAVTDMLWSGVLAVLQAFSFLPRVSLFTSWHIPKSKMWFYIIAVCIILSLIHVFKTRRYLYPKKSE